MECTHVTKITDYIYIVAVYTLRLDFENNIATYTYVGEISTWLYIELQN